MPSDRAAPVSSSSNDTTAGIPGVTTRTWICPNGHVSKSGDNCDHCGDQIQASDNASTATAVIDAGLAGARPATTNPDGTRTCHAPDGQGGECGQVNQPQDHFCQLCQASLDDVGSAGDTVPMPRPAKVVPPPSPPLAAAPVASPATASMHVPGVSAEAPNGWEIVAKVNHARATSARDRDDNAVELIDDAERCFPLVVRESLIGRRSDAKEVYPEIELLDPAVSRPHAMVRQEPDGSLTYVHLSAKSGSLVDGVKLTTGRSAPLHTGSLVIIGAYTELSIRPR